MNIAAIAAIGVLTIGGAAYADGGSSSSAPAPATSSSSTTPRCDEGNWPE
jgi:hypothetical protein